MGQTLYTVVMTGERAAEMFADRFERSERSGDNFLPCGTGDDDWVDYWPDLVLLAATFDPVDAVDNEAGAPGAPGVPHLEHTERAVVTERQALGSLLDHLNDCGVCVQDGTRFCDVFAPIRTIAEYAMAGTEPAETAL